MYRDAGSSRRRDGISGVRLLTNAGDGCTVHVDAPNALPAAILVAQGGGPSLSASEGAGSGGGDSGRLALRSYTLDGRRVKVVD